MNGYFPLCMEIRIGKRGKTCGKWEMGSGESSANNTKSDLNVGPACDKSNNITQSAVAFFRFVWLGLVPHGVCVTCVLMKYWILLPACPGRAVNNLVQTKSWPWLVRFTTCHCLEGWFTLWTIMIFLALSGLRKKQHKYIMHKTFVLQILLPLHTRLYIKFNNANFSYFCKLCLWVITNYTKIYEIQRTYKNLLS